ncbi:MAG TPA: peptidase M56 [Ruminiclostridium sp.]|nr:peptidase M56 [Ruminiclostridium sp.]
MRKIKKVILAVILFGIMGCVLDFAAKAIPDFKTQQDTKLYENKTYKVSLHYSKNWKINPKYVEKYEGNDGFFQVSAYSGKGLLIDEVVQKEVNHILKPYGSNPKVTGLSIQGQEARLIMPSEDQKDEFNHQAELIVKYPKAVKINESTYYFFILWADTSHIRQISDTLRFIG